jgi:isoamylase
VSYEQKHNEANGEKNQDGTNDNLSRNWGVEGETKDNKTIALRNRVVRSFLATLTFSQGVPMLAHGDEIGRTQSGNNNAYAQDNEITWVNWDLDQAQKDLLAFTRKLIALRQAYPVLRRRHFFRGQPVAGSAHKDVTWVGADGKELTDVDWRNPEARALGMLIDGKATDEEDERGHAVNGDTLLIITNSSDVAVSFTLPVLEGEGENIWVIMVDTSSEEAPVVRKGSVSLEAHAVMLLRFGIDRRLPAPEEQRRSIPTMKEQHTL